jgi:hypothetical protein
VVVCFFGLEAGICSRALGGKLQYHCDLNEKMESEQLSACKEQAQFEHDGKSNRYLAIANQDVRRLSFGRGDTFELWSCERGHSCVVACLCDLDDQA